MEDIDRSGAWAYFDDACQGNPPVYEAGGVIYLKDTHVLKFKAGLSRGIKQLCRTPGFETNPVACSWKRSF